MVQEEKRRLLVVTGPMRSGTTLIGNMLHGGARYRHPNLSFLPDTHTELRDLSAACAEGLATPLMSPDLPEEYFVGWHAAAPAVLSAFEQKALAEAPAPDPRVFGVKLTCLLPEIEALRSDGLYDPKFVVMTRDPRDIFASALKRYGDREEREYLAFMNASFALDYERLRGKDVLAVSYEDLVSDPRQTLSAVLAFAGLDPELYDWASLETGLMTNSSFLGIGPNDAIGGVGIKPSTGNHRSIEPLYRDALAEVFGLDGAPSLAKRIALHEEFFPRVIEIGERYGYRMAGLRATLRKKAGFLVPAALRIRGMMAQA